VQPSPVIDDEQMKSEKSCDEAAGASEADEQECGEGDSEEDQDEAEEKRRAEQAQKSQLKADVSCVEHTHNILPKFTDALREIVTSPQARINAMEDSIKYFKCIIPKVVARSPLMLPT
jgi:hypothetical protein